MIDIKIKRFGSCGGPNDRDCRERERSITHVYSMSRTCLLGKMFPYIIYSTMGDTLIRKVYIV